jgi:drug/metabolite transporter (DMT)-like permease
VTRAAGEPGRSAVAAPDPLTLLAFATVVVTGGLNAIAVRGTLGELAPFWSAGLRFVLAAVVMVALVLGSGRSFPRGRSLLGAMAYGAVGFAASFAFIYSGLVEVSAGTGAVLLALAPLFTFGLAIVQGLERFRLEGLIGAIVALVGVMVVFIDRLSADVPLASLVLIVLGTACIAEAGVIVKWTPRSDPFGTNAVAMATGAIVLLALTFVTGEPMVIPSQLDTIVSMAYLVVPGTVVMFAAYVYALGRWTASAVSYTTLLLPLVTLPMAALLSGESVTVWLIAGGSIILVGVYVGAFMKRPRRWSASSLPECLPVDGCVEPTSTPAPEGAR